MTSRGAMNQESIVVGIDVSENEFVIATHPSDDRWTSPTDPRAIDTLVQRLCVLQPQLIA